MRSLLPIAAIALIATGVLVGCDRLPGSVSDLSVGDCIEAPEEGLVSDVLHKPCDEAHTGEVLFVGNYPDGGDTIPSDEEFDEYVRATCIPAFEAYVGHDYETDEELDFAPILPTAEGWEDGDEEVVCVIVRIDGGEMTGSVKATD